MFCVRVLLMALPAAAPLSAQSNYVLELSNGQLSPAKSVERIAPSGPVRSTAGMEALLAAPVGQGSGAGPTTADRSARASHQGGIYFRSCNEAARAGYSQMLYGTPGYREGLDGDHDGVACEPYRNRR